MPERIKIPLRREEDFKSRRKFISAIAEDRIAYGIGALFDTHFRQPRYPLEVITKALRKAQKRARKHGARTAACELKLGDLEKRLLAKNITQTIEFWGPMICAVCCLYLDRLIIASTQGNSPEKSALSLRFEQPLFTGSFPKRSRIRPVISLNFRFHHRIIRDLNRIPLVSKRGS